MELQLKKKTAIVTGGASGIGWACALELAREGCQIALWDISATAPDMAQRVATECGVSAIGLVVDVSNQGSIESAATKSEELLGPIEIVVHAAAVTSGKFGFPFTNVPAAAWSRVLNVNVIGMANLAESLASRMVPRRSGSFVFVASVAGQIGSQTDPPYSASKAANINFAQCMARDLASQGIRVNTVCPGMVQTPLNRSVWQAWNEQQPADKRRSYEEWANEKVKSIVPLGRWQRPEDIAHMVAFLSSPCASEVTGQTINVDGGYVMHW